MAVKLVSHVAEVKAQLNSNTKAALEAMGVKGVGLVVSQMESGYGRPIRKTGNLMGSISFAVENSGKNTVDIGTSVDYATYVHEGTYKMAGRPFITDGIEGGIGELAAVAVAELQKGF